MKSFGLSQSYAQSYAQDGESNANPNYGENTH